MNNPNQTPNDPREESRSAKLLRRIQAAEESKNTEKEPPEAVKRRENTAPADHSPVEDPVMEAIKRSDLTLSFPEQVVKEETPAPRQLSERPVTQVNPFTVEDIDVIDRLISGTAPLNEASEAQVEEALARLDDKTRAVTQEFSSGRINQAQFQAIFTRYREQREIIKRMMSRNPDSDAWKTVAAEGVTNILRKQHSALVAGFVILNKKNGGLIKKLGTFSVKADLMVGLLDSLSDAEALAPPVVTQIEGGRYLALAQGYVTATIILYSSEPPQASLAQLKHLHEEFEFSNNPYLHENEIPVEKLVYPQSQLLTGLP